MGRFMKFVVGLVALNALLLGAVTAVLAAPPLQTNAGLGAQADNWVLVFDQLFGAMSAAILGGAWVFVLESFPAWREWKPAERGLPEQLKPLAVFLLTGGSVFVIAAAREIVVTQFPLLAPWLQVAILAVAGWLVSQLVYRWTKTTE